MRSMGLGQNRGGLGPTHWRDWRNLLSRRIGKVAGAFGRGGPIGRALAACRRKCLPHAFSIEIGSVHRCSGLLPPGVVQSAGIDRIETEFVDKLQDDGLGLCIVTRNGQGNSTRRSTRPTAFEQMALTRSTPRGASFASTATAPVSVTRLARVLGSLELAT